MNQKNEQGALRLKRRVGFLFLAIISGAVLVMTVPSSSRGQTYTTTISGNAGTISTFQDSTNTYFHSEWNTGFSVDGVPTPGLSSSFDWAVNTQTGVPAVGAGYYEIRLNGGIVSSGYSTNADVQTDHQLMNELSTGVTIYNYLDGVGSLLYDGIKNAYEYYYGN